MCTHHNKITFTSTGIKKNSIYINKTQSEGKNQLKKKKFQNTMQGNFDFIRF